MNILTKRFYIVCLTLCFALAQHLLFAVSLSADEIKTVNALSSFIELKPAGKDYLFCLNALKSGNELVKGSAAIVLYKHYGRSLMPFFIRSFATNPEVGRFKAQKQAFISADGLNKMLSAYRPYLKKLDDERLRKLFLFYHFRSANLYLKGPFGEELSLAEFYRIAAFEGILGEKCSSVKLALQLNLIRVKSQTPKAP